MRFSILKFVIIFNWVSSIYVFNVNGSAHTCADECLPWKAYFNEENLRTGAYRNFWCVNLHTHCCVPATDPRVSELASNCGDECLLLIFCINPVNLMFHTHRVFWCKNRNIHCCVSSSDPRVN